MNKTLVAIALAATLAVPGIALAQSFDIENMTQEQKDQRINAMELRQNMTQDRIDYMKGTITQEEFQTRQQDKIQQMKQIREQMHLTNSENGGCQMEGQNRGNDMGMGKKNLNRMGW